MVRSFNTIIKKSSRLIFEGRLEVHNTILLYEIDALLKKGNRKVDVRGPIVMHNAARTE
jgi:hypothetical protein